jgi:hypothetical protein
VDTSHPPPSPRGLSVERVVQTNRLQPQWLPMAYERLWPSSLPLARRLRATDGPHPQQRDPLDTSPDGRILKSLG